MSALLRSRPRAEVPMVPSVEGVLRTVARLDPLEAILRANTRASMSLAAGERGPEAVQDALGRLGEALAATRIALTTAGPGGSSTVWGALATDEPIEMDIPGVHAPALLRIWGVAPPTELERDALRGMGGVLTAMARSASLEGSDADRWLRRHMDSIPVVTYMEHPDDANPSGFTEVYVSAQIETLLGYTPQEWVEDDDMQRWSQTIHPDDRGLLKEEIERSAATGEDYCVEYRMRHKITGEWVWVRDVARLIRVEGDAQPYWHGVMIDITQRKTLEEQIAYLAYHDSLTGLANRKRFEEELALGLARARRKQTSVAVLFLDLNNFKRVNDTLGHDVGDRLLERVADRLRTATRDTDIVARQGGDEFLVLVADIDPRDDVGQFPVGATRAEAVAAELAGRIDVSLAEPFELDGEVVTTGASIGVSIYPQDAADSRTLLKNADMAMYAVKRSRRRRGYLIATAPTTEEDAG